MHQPHPIPVVVPLPPYLHNLFASRPLTNPINSIFYVLKVYHLLMSGVKKKNKCLRSTEKNVLKPPRNCLHINPFINISNNQGDITVVPWLKLNSHCKLLLLLPTSTYSLLPSRYCFAISNIPTTPC